MNTFLFFFNLVSDFTIGPLFLFQWYYIYRNVCKRRQCFKHIHSFHHAFLCPSYSTWHITIKILKIILKHSIVFALMCESILYPRVQPPFCSTDWLKKCRWLLLLLLLLGFLIIAWRKESIGPLNSNHATFAEAHKGWMHVQDTVFINIQAEVQKH